LIGLDALDRKATEAFAGHETLITLAADPKPLAHALLSQIVSCRTVS